MKYERMTANEIRRSYAEAKDPKAQIKILADLNLCKPEDIVAIIENRTDDLCNGKTSTRKKVPPETWAEIVKLYETGRYTHQKLAEMFGVSAVWVGKRIREHRKMAKESEPAEDKNEPMPNNSRPAPSLYEIAEELAEYIRHKHPGVDYISINRNGQTIRVVVENGKERIDIIKPRGETQA